MISLNSFITKVKNGFSAALINLSLFKIHKVIRSTSKSDQLISFCLFGNDAIYFNNVTNCIESYRQHFNNWKIRVYVSRDIPEHLVSLLKAYDCDIYIMKSKGIDFRFTFWRFLALDDKSLTFVLIRDIDSIASLREKKMVDEWLKSGRKLHVIRDHPAHTELIMAGLWGLKTNKQSEGMLRKMYSFKKLNRYGIDQEFLKGIYHRYSPYVMVHDIIERFNEKPVIYPHDNDCFYLGERNIDNGNKRFHRDEIAAIHNKSSLE